VFAVQTSRTAILGTAVGCSMYWKGNLGVVFPPGFVVSIAASAEGFAEESDSNNTCLVVLMRFAERILVRYEV
jgi:hypothetical protein